VKDVFRFDRLADTLQSIKPLFSLIVRMFINYAQIGLTALNMVYFLIYGPQIVSLLDAQCFGQVYHCKRSARRIACWGLVMNVLHFFVLYFDQLRAVLYEPFTFMSGLSLFCYFIMSTDCFFVCVLLLYQQYATRQVLKQMCNSLGTNAQNLGEILSVPDEYNKLRYCRIRPNRQTSISGTVEQSIAQFTIVSLRHLFVCECAECDSAGLHCDLLL